jgi:hypothetical protein
VRPAKRSLEAKLAGEVDELKGVAPGVLPEVGPSGMTTLGVFKIQNRVPLFAHSSNHFSRVAGMHAVVLRRGLDEHFGYARSGNMFWYGEYLRIAARMIESSGSPYSAAQLAPASNLV